MLRALHMGLLFALVGAATPANAVVPGTTSVLARTAKWVETLPATASWRLTVRAGDSAAIPTAVTLGSDRVFSGEEAAAPFRDAPTVALYAALLRNEGRAALTSAQVDVSVTSLFHHRRRVVVIVGARPGEAGRAQVWFDRETGAPVRVQVPRASESVERLVLGPHDWPGTGGVLPGQLELEAPQLSVRGALRKAP